MTGGSVTNHWKTNLNTVYINIKRVLEKSRKVCIMKSVKGAIH